MTHQTTTRSSSQNSARHAFSCHVSTGQDNADDGASPPPPPPLGSLDDPDSDQDAPASRGARGHGSDAGDDVVLMLGLPDVFTVGCDALSLTARQFVGVRDVPAGPHLFWAAHPGGMTARSGFWIVSEGGGRGAQAVVRWDDAAEQLGEADPGDSDAVTGLGAKLLSYRDPTASGAVDESRAVESERIWSQLTSAITADVLSRVTGQQPQHGGGRSIWHMSTTDHVQGEVIPSAEQAMEEHMASIRHTPAPAARELHFALDQHDKTYSTQRLGADRTRDATDSTSYLLAVLESGAATEADLVGELQLAFLAGAHLGSDACLEQWYHVALRLALRAFSLPRRRPSLAAAWLRTLSAQLAYGGSWLDVPLTEMLGEARARELRLALIVYKRRLEEEAAADMAVVTAFARLEAVVAGEGFEWDLGGEYVRRGRVVMEDGEEVELEMDELQAEDERGEWAPEVVELDEHGREKGLISWND